ncbi:leucine-rich repeat extensin-like protein 7 [Iris pallida]|uniref:Leucine-rich repeat extensin-like protein 7 n=1 Tax=Iris pallida TaxID=29817 RepID=A0AAX6G9D3_IRIPA|nr:leucine-rich repeat extensin-like protein 7 [Iris pallida]KAJ6850669.1 leucine-rich repeat extensin-like protein 7 [Iris pallida]
MREGSSGREAENKREGVIADLRRWLLARWQNSATRSSGSVLLPGPMAKADHWMLPDLTDLADPALPRVQVAHGGHRRFMDCGADLQ